MEEVKMNQDRAEERSFTHRPRVGAVSAAAAVVAAVVLAVAAWLLNGRFDEGWPDDAGWWAITAACSLVIVFGQLVAVLNVARSTSAVSAVSLAAGLTALAIGVASWGQFAALAEAHSAHAQAMQRCGKEMRAMSVDDVVASRYLSSVAAVRPIVATSLYMIQQPVGFGGGFAAKQRDAAAETWDTLRADERSVEDICATTLAQYGVGGSAGVVQDRSFGYGAATGDPVDVIVG